MQILLVLHEIGNECAVFVPVQKLLTDAGTIGRKSCHIECRICVRMQRRQIGGSTENRLAENVIQFSFIPCSRITQQKRKQIALSGIIRLHGKIDQTHLIYDLMMTLSPAR